VASSAAREPVEWAVAHRCRPGEARCGDLAVVALLPDGVAIMIADDADEVVSVLCGLDDGRRLRISSSARDIVLTSWRTGRMDCGNH